MLISFFTLSELFSPCSEKGFYLQGERFLLARINVSTCRDKHLSLRTTKIIHSSEMCNRYSEKCSIYADCQYVAWNIFLHYLCGGNKKTIA